MSLPENAFPVWEYVKDQMDYWEWSRERLAIQMGGNPMVNLCALDMLEAQAESEPGTNASKVRLGERMARGLGLAFGTSHQLWMNLDESFQRVVNPPAPPSQGESA